MRVMLPLARWDLMYIVECVCNFFRMYDVKHIDSQSDCEKYIEYIVSEYIRVYKSI